MLRRFVFLAAVLTPMFSLIRAPRADAAQQRVVILEFQNDSEDPAFTWLTTVMPEVLESWCDGRDLARRQGLKKRERRFDRSVKRFIRLHPRLSCPY